MNFNPETPRVVGSLGALAQGDETDPGPGRLLIAPVIDLVLIILCVVVVTFSARRLERELTIELPVSDEAAPVRRSVAELVVNIDADGQIRLNGQEVDLTLLRRRFQRATGAFAGTDAVLLRADGATPHRRIIEILSACRAAGLRSVSFAIAPDEDPRGGPDGGTQGP